MFNVVVLTAELNYYYYYYIYSNGRVFFLGGQSPQR